MFFSQFNPEDAFYMEGYEIGAVACIKYQNGKKKLFFTRREKLQPQDETEGQEQLSDDWQQPEPEPEPEPEREVELCVAISEDEDMPFEFKDVVMDAGRKISFTGSIGIADSNGSTYVYATDKMGVVLVAKEDDKWNIITKPAMTRTGKGLDGRRVLGCSVNIGAKHHHYMAFEAEGEEPEQPSDIGVAIGYIPEGPFVRLGVVSLEGMTNPHIRFTDGVYSIMAYKDGCYRLYKGKNGCRFIDANVEITLPEECTAPSPMVVLLGDRMHIEVAEIEKSPIVCVLEGDKVVVVEQ